MKFSDTSVVLWQGCIVAKGKVNETRSDTEGIGNTQAQTKAWSGEDTDVLISLHALVKKDTEPSKPLETQYKIVALFLYLLIVSVCNLHDHFPVWPYYI